MLNCGEIVDESNKGFVPFPRKSMTWQEHMNEKDQILQEQTFERVSVAGGQVIYPCRQNGASDENFF